AAAATRAPLVTRNRRRERRYPTSVRSGAVRLLMSQPPPNDSTRVYARRVTSLRSDGEHSMNAEPPRPRTVGHRGASALAPENTLRAVQLAIDHGLDLVEVDVHLSRDGEVMVIHDEDLRALARGTERVADLTAAELARVDLGAGQSVPRPLEASLVDALHAAGLLVMAPHTNDPAEARAFAQRGIDVLATDDPQVLSASSLAG